MTLNILSRIPLLGILTALTSAFFLVDPAAAKQTSRTDKSPGVQTILDQPCNTTGSFTSSNYVAPSGNDRGPGTTTKPWRTINRAARSAAPGTIVHVAPGTYRENVIIARGGIATNPVAFVSDRKWLAHIIGVTYAPVVDIRNGHVCFAGFSVSNPDGAVGIQVSGASGAASYDRIIGNEVHDIAGPCKLGKCSPGSGIGGAGIVVSNTTDNLGHDNDVMGNLVHDIGDPTNPQNADLVHGVYIELGGDLNYPGQAKYSAKVQNNIIYRIEGDGITSWHCVSHIMITNNTIVEAGVHGILLSASYRDCMIGDKNKPNTGSIVANNIVVHNGWHAACGNTMIQTHRCLRPDFGGGCGIASFHATNARVVHNLSFDNRCHNSTNGLVTLSDPPSAGVVAADNVTANPLFKDYQNSNYHLTAGSLAIGHGDASLQPRIDFDGTLRSARSADIGAYVFTSTH
jgi:hypothetical protein